MAKNQVARSEALVRQLQAEDRGREPLVIAAPYVANLPEGTIQLAAVSRYKPAGPQWWGPDGRLIEKPDFEIAEADLAALPIMDYHLFVFRVDRPGAEAVEPEWSVGLVRPEPEFEGIKIRRAKDIAGTREIWWIAAPIQTNIHFAELRLGLPAGGWSRVAKASPNLTNVEEYRWPGDGNWQVKFNEVRHEGSDLRLVLTRREDGGQWHLRVIALDTNGLEHLPAQESAGGRAGEEYTWQILFKNLAADQVKEFVVQAQRCHWARFEHVSLESTSTTR